MVKYTISILQAMIGAKTTGTINKIHENPTFSMLWPLQRQIVDRLQKIGNIKFSLDGHTNYILSKEYFALFLSKEWRDK